MREFFVVTFVIIAVMFVGERVSAAGYFNAEVCKLHHDLAEYIVATKPEDRSAILTEAKKMRTEQLLSEDSYRAIIQVYNLYVASDSETEFLRDVDSTCPAEPEVSA
mgnify:CR=1 FL=1